MARAPTVEPPGTTRAGLPRTQLVIARHPEVPAEVHRRVSAQMTARRLTEQLEYDDRAARVDALIGGAREERRAILGDKAHDRYRAYVTRARKKIARSTLPPAGLRLTPPARERSRADERSRFSDMLRKIGAERSRLDAHNATVLRDWQGAQPRTSPIGKFGPILKQELIGQVSLLSHSPGVLHFVPPYTTAGIWAQFSQVQSDDFIFSGFFLEADPSSGALGHVNQTEIWDDIDDFESSDATMRSLLGFWLELPAGTQSVAIYVLMDPISTFHAYHLENEWWGESNSQYFQHSALFSELIGVNNSEQSVLGLSFKSGPSTKDNDQSEGSEQTHFYQDVGTKWFGWNSKVPQLTAPPNGTFVWAWVGLETRNHLFVDDVFGLSGVTSRWRIREILVQPMA